MLSCTVDDVRELAFRVAVAGQDVLDYDGLIFELWNGREIVATLKESPHPDLPGAVTDMSCFTELEPVTTLVNHLLTEGQAFTTSTVQPEGRVVLEWTIRSPEPKET